MASVRFTPNLNRHLPCPPSEVTGGTLREALDQVFIDNPLLRSYILDDQSRLRPHVLVFINNVRASDTISLSDPIGSNDEIFVFQALSGG